MIRIFIIVAALVIAWVLLRGLFSRDDSNNDRS